MTKWCIITAYHNLQWQLQIVKTYNEEMKSIFVTLNRITDNGIRKNSSLYMTARIFYTILYHTNFSNGKILYNH